MRQRQRYRFRPGGIEGLEERVVLSAPPTLADLWAAQSQPTALDFQSVQNPLNAAFGEFRNDFAGAEVNFLNAARNATPAAITKALNIFHHTTDQLVSQLLASVEVAVSPLPGALTGLLPAIMIQINGSFSGSLLNELNAIPATTGAKGEPDVLYPQVAAAAVNATQLAANDMLTAYWTGYLDAYLSHGTAPSFDYAQVQATINQAFTTLQASYKAAEANFLKSGGSATPKKPTSTAFATLRVQTALQIDQTLAQLGSKLASVPGAPTGLLTLLTVQTNGGFTGSLGTGLGLTPIASGPSGTIGTLFPLVSTDLFDSTQLAANNLLSVSNSGRIAGLSSAGFSVTPFVATAPVLTIAQLVQLNAAGTGAQQAYMQFQSAFQTAVTTTLYAHATAGASGQVDLSGNQAAFNTRIAAALGALDRSLEAALAPYASATNNLLPSVRQALIGAGAISLQARLAALPTPTDLFGFTTVQFLNRANALIVASYLDTTTRLNGAVANPAFNFAGFTGSASFVNGPFGIQLVSKPFVPAPLGGLSVSNATGVTV
jgi:hypothetical protein